MKIACFQISRIIKQPVCSRSISKVTSVRIRPLTEGEMGGSEHRITAGKVKETPSPQHGESFIYNYNNTFMPKEADEGKERTASREGLYLALS